MEAKSTKAWKICADFASTSSGYRNEIIGGQLLPRRELSGNNKEKSSIKKRVFFLDVNPLCYAGSTPSLHSFGHWISLFFSQVSFTDPVIAVSSFFPLTCKPWPQIYVFIMPMYIHGFDNGIIWIVSNDSCGY